MDDEGPVAKAMREKLTVDFTPVKVAVVDDSDRHRGHAGHDGAGESHFTVSVVAAAFEGVSRTARHRMVYASLQAWIGRPVHALAIKALAPGEAGQNQAR